MIVLLFVSALTAFLFSSFAISLNLQAINRSIIYMPKEVFETAIPLVNIDEEEGLYFDKAKLSDNIETYLDNNVYPRMKNYRYSLYFYNQENHSICVRDQCNAVELTVTGTYVFNFKYRRSVSYEIHQGAKYGQ